MCVKSGFDNQKYIQLQSEHIIERVEKFGDKLYLELGGKLFDDYHASRVLPGFEPDSKIKMLMALNGNLEIIIAISAFDIEKNKVRGDYNITYDVDTLRLIDTFRSLGLYVGSVVITKYMGQESADRFKKRLENLGISVYTLRFIEGYPSNIDKIISEDGFGKSDYINTTRPIVVVTAPGPGSGKMAVCLSQLYHENKNGIKAGYAKFETFPIWNLPLKHPVNLAYEAATVDLSDVNMIDPFHLEAYGKTTVNYNRDIETFPILDAMFKKVLGYSPYKSPTDMGVNMVGNCIINDEICCEASKKEIIRRYYQLLKDKALGKIDETQLKKIEMIMRQAEVTVKDRKVIDIVLDRAEKNECAICGFELDNGGIVTGKESSLLSCSSAAFLNSLKVLASIDDSIHLISPSVLEPLQSLKINKLGMGNLKLQLEETLLALSISAVSDENSKKALDCLDDLRGIEAHSSIMLSVSDELLFKRLGINLTCEPNFERLYL